jgi:type IV pilus assembly protein PilC
MPQYKYTAINNDGEKITGNHFAENKDIIISMILSNEYVPVRIDEMKEGLGDLNKFKRIKNKDIAVFCRQFETMLKAGVSVTTAINILSKQSTNEKLRAALRKVEENVRKGDSLSNSMKNCEAKFPNILIRMVEVGELSGTLGNVMESMAVYFEKETKMNGKVKSALIYPAVLLSFTIIVVVFILTFIMPMFVSMFKDSGTELPAITKFLLGISSFLQNHGLLLLISIVSIMVAFKVTISKEPRFIRFMSKVKLKVPVIRGLMLKNIVSRFTRTLSTVLKAGVPLVKALEVIETVVENKIAEEEVKRIKAMVIQGEGLSKPMMESNLFPKMLASMVNIGEESGSLDNILIKTSEFYDDELEREIQTFTSLIEPVMLIFMGVIVGFVIISIITPMFGMFNTV